MSKIIKLFHFLASLVGGWLSLMSGMASIPLAYFALFSNETHPKWWFALLAIFTLWISIIIMAYKNYPRFKLDCSKDIELCATPKNAHEARYFRMRVSTHCVNGIDQCSGNLEKIEKDGVVVFEGDATELPFSHPERRSVISILIKPDIDYWLDILVVMVSHHSEIQLRIFEANAASGYTLPEIKDIVYIRTKQPHTPANDVAGRYIFDKSGEYILYVSVSGKGVPTAKAQLKFNWTGKANDSTIERIK
jgi:hypothetical protein